MQKNYEGYSDLKDVWDYSEATNKTYGDFAAEILITLGGDLADGNKVKQEVDSHRSNLGNVKGVHTRSMNRNEERTTKLDAKDLKYKNYKPVEY